MRRPRVKGKMQSLVAGELIQQQNPEKTYAGQGADTIGPGRYEIRREVGDRRKGVNWHASNVKRLAANLNKTAADSLGPGAYEVAASGSSMMTAPQQSRPRGTSCFASRVPRAKALGASLAEAPRADTVGAEEEDSSETDEGEMDVIFFVSDQTIGRHARAGLLQPPKCECTRSSWNAGRAAFRHHSATFSKASDHGRCGGWSRTIRLRQEGTRIIADFGSPVLCRNIREPARLQPLPRVGSGTRGRSPPRFLGRANMPQRT